MKGRTVGKKRRADQRAIKGRTVGKKRRPRLREMKGNTDRKKRQRPQRDEVDLSRELLGILDRRFRRLGIRDAIVPLETVEHAYMRVVLALCDGNRSRTARLLRIGRNTLLRRGRRVL